MSHNEDKLEKRRENSCGAIVEVVDLSKHYEEALEYYKEHAPNPHDYERFKPFDDGGIIRTEEGIYFLLEEGVMMGPAVGDETISIALYGHSENLFTFMPIAEITLSETELAQAPVVARVPIEEHIRINNDRLEQNFRVCNAAVRGSKPLLVGESAGKD